MPAQKPKLPALDPKDVKPVIGSDYPPPHDQLAKTRERRQLGDALGLANFGVNLLRLPPGCASSQRHWHTKQDEFVFVVSGEVVLVTDGGEQTLTSGMVAGFPAGTGDGHHLLNRGNRDAILLEVGDRMPADEVDYSDIDMKIRWINGEERFLHKDGKPY